MSDLKCFLINLDGSTDRIALAGAELSKIDLTFERIPAVNGRLLDLDAQPDYSKAQTQSYFGRELSAGEVGCFLSHFKALRRFLETEARYALILEDDIVIRPGGEAIWADLVTRLDDAAISGWGFIDVGAPPHKLYTAVFPVAGGHGNQLCRSHYFSFGAHAILWSRQGAQMALKDGFPMNAPYDIFLRAWNARKDIGYALLEPPFGVSGLDSDIEAVTNRSYHQSRWAQIKRRLVEKPAVYLNMVMFRLKRLLKA
ncbi:glycosyltransferase family 25 protein [Aestuariivita boseongensis]|jgi:glycosyl transferase family 25|uniref:glycosyltransferase family 25 protein n=1 Tax=Aestuariivita boseongensis TaxID=1470562 RepID=UPI0006824AC9|nr:glycosyltransferase family 25 protein [Aestuariivita boseongensis]